MQQAMWLLALVAVFGLLIAVGAALLISRNVVRSVNTVQSAAQSFAAGDLSKRVQIHSGDELESLGNSFNTMADRIQQQIETQRAARRTLEQGTQEISAASSEILAAVSEHTASANQQSAAINQVSATVSEAQASSQQAATKAAEVADLATDALRVGQEGA
ncbi:MAG: HAMP domain-containing protein, partial [Caldilineaceae bacterium]|nr:HAMP domain-containing protein [Caldilineaceae bacterium]